MSDIQAPWVGGEYEPMIDSDKPFAVCEYCGCSIYAGDTFLDADKVMCEDCLSKNIRKAG